jgi:hypothetical protein
MVRHVQLCCCLNLLKCVSAIAAALDETMDSERPAAKAKYDLEFEALKVEWKMFITSGKVETVTEYLTFATALWEFDSSLYCSYSFWKTGMRNVIPKLTKHDFHEHVKAFFNKYDKRIMAAQESNSAAEFDNLVKELEHELEEAKGHVVLIGEEIKEQEELCRTLKEKLDGLKGELEVASLDRVKYQKLFDRESERLVLIDQEILKIQGVVVPVESPSKRAHIADESIVLGDGLDKAMLGDGNDNQLNNDLDNDGAEEMEPSRAVVIAKRSRHEEGSDNDNSDEYLPSSNKGPKLVDNSVVKAKKKSSKSARESNDSERPTPTHAELGVLAEQTQNNINAGIKELKDELRRTSGKVVESDHPCKDSNGRDYAAEYTLNEDLFRQQLERLFSDESSSDSSDSGDEEQEEPDRAKIVEPKRAAGVAYQPIHVNPSGWNISESNSSPNANRVPTDTENQELFEEHALNDARKEKREKELEELHKEIEQDYENAHYANAEKNKAQREEDTARKEREAEQEEQTKQDDRNEERERKRLERENDQPDADFDEDRDAMSELATMRQSRQ